MVRTGLWRAWSRGVSSGALRKLRRRPVLFEHAKLQHVDRDTVEGMILWWRDVEVCAVVGTEQGDKDDAAYPLPGNRSMPMVGLTLRTGSRI